MREAFCIRPTDFFAFPARSLYDRSVPRFQHVVIRFDWILLLSILALTSVGLVVVYGIGLSRPEVGIFVFQKQIVALAIGGALTAALTLFDYRHLRGLALPIYLFGAAILAGVLFFGTTVRGTRGWYVIGGLSLQPVEIAKVCLVIFLASYLVRFARRLPWQAIAGSFLATAGYAGLVLFQPDFGSAMVMFALWFCAILFIGLPWKVLLSFVSIGAVIASCVWFFALEDYQQDRFLAFIDPTHDARGAGYNVTQARIAIGSGGLLGMGVGEGSQSRLRFLPEASTDFTFAVIGEELGFVGIAFILGLYALFFTRCFLLARNAGDDFASILIFGIGTIFLIHITINAGMNLGIMPVTGIPLPFISAASSFMIAVFLCVGIIESIAVHRRASG